MLYNHIVGGISKTNDDIPLCPNKNHHGQLSWFKSSSQSQKKMRQKNNSLKMSTSIFFLHVSAAITLRSASLRCSSSLSRSDLTTTSIPMSNRWSPHWVVVQKKESESPHKFQRCSPIKLHCYYCRPNPIECSFNPNHIPSLNPMNHVLHSSCSTSSLHGCCSLVTCKDLRK